MVNHGTQVSSIVTEGPDISADSVISIQPLPTSMGSKLPNSSANGPIADDYDVTEKCLNWQNNCTTTEGLHNLNSRPVSLDSTDNKIIYTVGETADNPHCLASYNLQGENTDFPKSTNDNTVYACDFSSQDKLAGCKYCSSSDALSHSDDSCSRMSNEASNRIRRDSEESEESMDTSLSMASSSYAHSLTSKFAETLSYTSGSGNLIHESLSEHELEQNLNELKHKPSKDACTISLKSDPQKPTLTPVAEEIVNVPSATPVPFSCSVEQPDPDFIKNPPVVTDNLIYVEDESFLYQSQNSLNLSPFHDCRHGKFLVRASTLPDLQAYHRYHDEYGTCWGYHDTRIFLSEDMLSASMCSLSESRSWFMKNDLERECSYGDRKVTYRQIVDVEGNPVKSISKSNQTTAIILLSLCVSILFASTDVIRNLQTSLHPEHGLGMTSLVLIFAGYTLGSLLSRPLLQHAQPRVCLIISILPNILFLLANLSSTLWLLAPISFLQGTSMAVTWSILSTYISHLASKQAISTKENIKAACCRFFNYFSLIYQSLLLVGNLASSVLLKYGNDMHSMNSSLFSSSVATQVGTNDADQTPKHMLANLFLSANMSVNQSADSTRDSMFGVCGASYRNPGHVIDNGDPWLHPNDGTIYMLHGTFIGCILVSLGMAVFGIEPLNMSLFSTPAWSESRQMKNLWTTMKKSFRSLIQGCFTLNFILLLPLFMYSVMQFGFISAEFTVAFITCSVGIDQIGFGMVFFIVGRFPTSFFCGFLSKKCGRLPLITIASAINLISLIILAQWHPGPAENYLLHTLMFCWGLSDGIWISQVNGLISSVFKLHFEATSGGMRVAQGLGVTIFLSISKFVDMKIKVFVMIGACLLALTGYLVLRICLYCENLHTQRQQRNAYHIYTGPPKEGV